MPREPKKKTESVESYASPAAERPMPADHELVTGNDREVAAPVMPAFVDKSVSDFDMPKPVEQETRGSIQEEPNERERFRSWVTDNASGYSRMTDEQQHRIVVQFHQRPSPEILAAVKEAGFQFQSDYFGHKNAWIRRNDYTGRVQVEAIEKLVRARSSEPESPER